MSIFSELSFVRDEIREIPGVERKPRGGLGAFLDAIGPALRLALVEREIFIFALGQWAAIALGYLLWVQMLDWIPQAAWRAAAENDGSWLIDLVLLGWSFLCVGVVAFPLGVFSGCMGAAHLLHRRGERSSIARCLLMVMPRGWALWGFHWADGWVTVNQILERLPRKRGNRSPGARALSEALYYAWKLGIAGVLPSIVCGNGLVQSGLNSVEFVKARFREVALLRTGYSTLCWLVGILAYVGAVVFLQELDLVPAGGEVHQHIHAIYLWAGVPVVIAAAAVVLVLRPVYVIALCEVYARHLEESGETVHVAHEPPPALSAVVAFVFLAMILVIAYLFGEQFGIGDWLSRLAP